MEPAFLKTLCTPLGRALSLALGAPCVRCHGLVESAWLGALCRGCWGAMEWDEDDQPAAGRYVGRLAEAVRMWKFEGRRSLTRGFARAMEARAREAGAEAIAVIPPTEASLKDKGGFDHAGELGRALAWRLRIPLARGILWRAHEGGKQKSRSRAKRLSAMQGAFGASLPARLEGARILLIDDVRTTGATLEEGAKALAQAGAGKVERLSLARTPKLWP